jgi:hypothetical protein
MHLISCDNCGVVLDREKLNFPIDIYEEDRYTVNTDAAMWSGDRYVPKAECPVCYSDIPKE